MSRVFNFSAGPATLAEDVLKQAQEEMVDWNGTGMSVMEMSHRGKDYVSIAEEAEADLRELMNIPANYKVLFLQGGASAQFAAIPMNILGDKKTADYVCTGSWSKKAIADAKKYCEVNVVAQPDAFNTIPDQSEWKLNPDAAYLHICSNETIEGVEFKDLPECGDVPLVADMSSNILSRPIDVTKYGLIYAGTQKNIGPAGMAIVIVREDLIGNAMPITPSVLDYQKQADADSMLNTPPTYTWYMAGLAFKNLKKMGGLEAVAKINDRKAAKLYACIDASDFYATPVEAKYRSVMNVPFTLPSADLDAAFLDGAKKAGLVTLKGHRSVGGMRASIYNAMPEEGVDALIAYMQEFEKANA